MAIVVVIAPGDRTATQTVEIGDVGERAAVVAIDGGEEGAWSLETADEQIRVAVVVEIAEGSAGFAQSRQTDAHSAEAPGTIVAVDLAVAKVEQVQIAIVIEISPGDRSVAGIRKHRAAIRKNAAIIAVDSCRPAARHRKVQVAVAVVITPNHAVPLPSADRGHCSESQAARRCDRSSRQDRDPGPHPRQSRRVKASRWPRPEWWQRGR